jgi:prepilin-type N-terminal cleavage/methylation domain-containing protein
MRNRLRNAEIGTGRAFSLVEVLAAITIIGVITFLAIPNIVRLKQDGEDNLARSRAEAANMAIASYVQAKGTNVAQTAWAGASEDTRYGLISPYIAFAEPVRTNYIPQGYTFAFPTNIATLAEKTHVTNTTTSQPINY